MATPTRMRHSFQTGWCYLLTNNLIMKISKQRGSDSGKIGWILLWAIGIPIPLLLIFFVIRGCT